MHFNTVFQNCAWDTPRRAYGMSYRGASQRRCYWWHNERPAGSGRQRHWCATHSAPKKLLEAIAHVPQCLCVLIFWVLFARHCVEQLETPGGPAAAVGRAPGRVH